jgi:plastocyanin
VARTPDDLVPQAAPHEEDQMRQIARGFAMLAAGTLVIACGGGSPTAAPTVAATAGAPTTAATVAPTTAGVATTAPEASCHEPAAGEATDVQADVAGFEWGAVSAKVGDVITWTNGDSAPHAVKTDDGSCVQANNIPASGTGSLVFDKAGSYPFICKIHPQMKGTITIT